MKKLLLLGVLLVVSAMLHAETVPRLPDAMLGRWCLLDQKHVEGGRFEGASMLFGRKNETCTKKKSFLVGEDHAGTCKIEMIVPSKDGSFDLRCSGNAYQVIKLFDDRFLSVEDMPWRSRPDEFD
jgi:hypothetical protein